MVRNTISPLSLSVSSKHTHTHTHIHHTYTTHSITLKHAHLLEVVPFTVCLLLGGTTAGQAGLVFMSQ